MYWRQLVLLLLAWYCGVWAEDIFPVFQGFRPYRWADWMSLIMYKPAALVSSAILMVTGSFLALRVTFQHAISLFRLSTNDDSHWLLHATLCMFGLLVFYVQAGKFPFGTTLVIVCASCWMLLRLLSIHLPWRKLREPTNRK